MSIDFIIYNNAASCLFFVYFLCSSNFIVLLAQIPKKCYIYYDKLLFLPLTGKTPVDKIVFIWYYAEHSNPAAEK